MQRLAPLAVMLCALATMATAISCDVPQLTGKDNVGACASNSLCWSCVSPNPGSMPTAYKCLGRPAGNCSFINATETCFNDCRGGFTCGTTFNPCMGVSTSSTSSGSFLSYSVALVGAITFAYGF
jgi:hypothetical protein